MATSDLIPGSGGVRAPDAQRPDFFRDTEMGRNVNNGANALGGLAAVTRAAQGLRSAAAAPQGLRLAAPGAAVAGTALTPYVPKLPGMANITAANGNMLAATGRTVAGISAADGVIRTNRMNLGEPSMPKLPDMQGISLGSPASAPSEAYSNEGRNYTTAEAATSVPGNSVTRVGNAFSGSNIRDGFTTNGGRDKSNMNTAPGFGFDAALEQRTSEARQGAVDAQRVLDGYGPGPNGGGMTGIRSSGKVTATNEAEFNASRRQYLLEQGLNSRNKGVRDASARGIAEGDPQAGLGANERIASMREQGESARAAAQQNAALRMNRDNNAVSLRGQDVSLQGQRATARLAQQTAERDQGNKDRQYQLDVGKFGKEVADTNMAQRTSRENQIQKNIESRAVGADGEVDKQAAAEYRTGIDRSAARLGLEGAHKLSPKDEQRLMDGTDLLRTMRANSGMLPWKPDQLKTIDPVDLTQLRVLPNGDRQITRADSKAAGQIIPRRFFDTEEGVRFFGGTKTNRYDMLSEGAQ